jgi:hypothetical protein
MRERERETDRERERDRGRGEKVHSGGTVVKQGITVITSQQTF